MITKIAIGLDGSELAEQSLAYAEGLAQVTKASCLLIQVVAAASDGAGDPELRGAAQSYLTGVAANVRARGVTVEVAVAAGEPSAAFVGEAAKHASDLLVLTTHGRSGLSRLIYGSVAQSVLAQTTIPTLLVRCAEGGHLSFSTTGLGPIVVPVDGSLFGESSISIAVELARALDVGIHLVEVVVPIEMLVQTGAGAVPYIPVDLIEAEDAAAVSYLDRLAAKLRADGLTVHRTERSDTAAAGILATADEVNASFVVMATHGRSGAARAILGSVALDVLRSGSHPVVFVRPTA